MDSSGEAQDFGLATGHARAMKLSTWHVVAFLHK